MSAIAIYGATGRTGRAVAELLCGLGRSVVLCGRDGAALEAMSRRYGDAPWRVASVDDRDSCVRAFRGARALVQCASLTANAATAIAQRAVEQGAAYLDVSADATISEALSTWCRCSPDRPGVPLCPGLGPIGGALAEWLTMATIGRLRARIDEVSEVELTYCSRGVPWSAGSLHSALRMFLRAPAPETRVVRLPPPFSTESVFAFPLGTGTLADALPEVPIATSLALSPWLGSHTTTELLLRAHRLARELPCDAVADQLGARLVAADRGRRSDRTSSLELPFAVTACVRTRHRSLALGVSARHPYFLTAAMIELTLRALLVPERRLGLGGLVPASELVDSAAALSWLAKNAGLQIFACDNDAEDGSRTVVEEAP